MKQVNEKIIAKKYALAFCKVHDTILTQNTIQSITTIALFLNDHKNFYVSLNIPNISRTIKQEALKKIQHTFNAPQEVLSLMMTLLDHKRIEILDKVLHAIVTAYQKKHTIETYHISTSHNISEAEKKSISAYIKQVHRKKNVTVVPQFTIDKTLIAGMRIESDMYIWERSIRKKLLHIRHSILHKG